MGIRQTHTYVELELSAAAYDEIARTLRAAGYDHAFMDDGTIDMHGIGVTALCSYCPSAGGACESCMNTGRQHG